MNIETVCNTPDEVLFEHVHINSHRHVPWLKMIEAHDKHAVIVGGGPSVADWIDEIKVRKEHGQTIFALNNAAKWLVGHGIVPDYCIVVDARDHNIGFVGYAETDLLSSQCHPSLFDKSPNAILWHQEYPGNMEEFEASIPASHPEHTLIGGGTTVGLSGMVVAYALGFRQLHLYGYDSSYRGKEAHAYQQTDPQRVDCVVTVAGKSFRSTLAMAKQAELFPQLSDSLIDLGCTITIRGDGLLPWISKMSALPERETTEQEKYQRMWDIPSYRNIAPGEEVADVFLGLIKDMNYARIIDFGSGTGRGALKIKHNTAAEVLMLDFADNCLDENVRLSLDESFKFSICDLTKNVEQNGDIGYCTDVLEHIEPDKVIQVIKNILTSCPQAFFQISTVPDRMGKLIGKDLHLTVRPSDWWIKTFESLGYEVLFSTSDSISVMLFVSQPLEVKNA